MGGIPLLNLGALPPMANPAAGIPKVNPLLQLGQEANQIPVEMEKQSQLRNQTQIQKEQLEDMKRKTVQERYDRNIQLVKNNPALKGSKPLISAIDADAKTLGIVAPITDKSVVGPAATAISSGPTAASPTGGAAPAGAPSSPGQVTDDGFFGPAPGAAAPAGAAAAAAPLVPGQAPGTIAPMHTDAGGREIDMQAIAPPPKYTDWAAVPGNLKEAFSLSPDQRRAAYSQIFPDAPESFYTAKQTYGMEQQQADMTARSIATQTLKNGDPSSIGSMMNAIAPMLASDPNIDPSKLIDPAFWTSYNQLAKDKLEIQRKAGIISEKTLDLRTRQIDENIKLGQSRIGLNQLTAQQKQIQNQYMPQELQGRIDKMAGDLTNATKNASTRAQELQEKIKNDGVTNASKDRADALHMRAQLQTNVNSLRTQANSITASGMDQTPVTGADGQPSTVGVEIGKKIIAAEAARDQLDSSIQMISNPKLLQKPITNALPGATKSRPANVPQGATLEGTFGPNKIPAYADPKTGKAYDAKTGQPLN